MSLSTKVARAGSLLAVLFIGVFAFACSGGSAPGTAGGNVAEFLRAGDGGRLSRDFHSQRICIVRRRSRLR